MSPQISSPDRRAARRSGEGKGSRQTAPDLLSAFRRGDTLTPALRCLVETALLLRTTNNRRLAVALVCSEETVKSGFRRLSCQLNTHSRAETLLHLLLCGAVHLPDPPGRHPGASGSAREAGP